MGVVDEVLVGPLRPNERRSALLGRLDGLPERLRVALRGFYLQGTEADQMAQSCRLTPREFDQLRAEAIAALGRTSVDRSVPLPTHQLFS
jgi:DNA-directed RNA polymerase specialized sigma24 family protein